MDPVRRPGGRAVGPGGDEPPAAAGSPQPRGAHQPLDRAAGDRQAFSLQLPPDLTRAVDAEVLLEDPLNHDLQFGVPPGPGRTFGGINPLADMRIVG